MTKYQQQKYVSFHIQLLLAQCSWECRQECPFTGFWILISCSFQPIFFDLLFLFLLHQFKTQDPHLEISYLANLLLTNQNLEDLHRQHHKQCPSFQYFNLHQYALHLQNQLTLYYIYHRALYLVVSNLYA